MAKLYFYYGAMGSSKTADALMTVYNYEEKGQKALLAKTETDTRDGKLTIRSRIGLEKECVLLRDVFSMPEKELKTYDVIVVDEAQFALREEIDKLAEIVDMLGIPVICYGLRTDFSLNFFEGSGRLMAIADVIKERKTMCWCGKKATCNARYDTNGIVREGRQIELGSNYNYISLCRKHFMMGMLRDRKNEFYQYSELSDEAKGHAKEWYLSTLRSSEFTDLCGDKLSVLFPNSKLNVQYSLDYRQGDGVNIYGMIYMDEVLDNIKEKFSEYEFHMLSKVFEKYGSSYEMKPNHSSCYCTCSDNDFMEDYYGLIPVELSDEVAQKFNDEAGKYLDDLCNELKGEGYRFFYEIPEENMQELCNENKWEFTKDGKFHPFEPVAADVNCLRQ